MNTIREFMFMSNLYKLETQFYISNNKTEIVPKLMPDDVEINKNEGLNGFLLLFLHKVSLNKMILPLCCSMDSFQVCYLKNFDWVNRF